VSGRASQIEDLGDGRILRRGGDPAREARLMEHARSHGYPVPRIDEVRADALVLERIEGPTMQAELARRPWSLPRHMETLAELHDRLHRIEHPDGRTLLHLDLHPANVILGRDGPVVIDWTNAAPGEPALDPALVWVIFKTAGVRIGHVAAALFARHVELRSAIPEAIAYRLADPHTFPRERDRLERLRRRFC
jgi:tRNA A-37 threonylcarbamoyl transferase component Bud32